MTFTSADLAQLIDRSRKLHVGLEDTFDRMWRIHNGANVQVNSNYPPYNIIRDGDKYTIEIAVAGFNKDDIDIELKESELVISGKVESSPSEDGPKYVHRGIAAREFTRTFIVSDDVVVKGADMQNGMLFVFLEHVVPDSKKPRKIAIGYNSNKQLLNEAA